MPEDAKSETEGRAIGGPSVSEDEDFAEATRNPGK